MRSKILNIATIVTFVLLWASPIRAHPHAWIDVQVDVIFNSSGSIIALKETWVLDEFYSADVVDDHDPKTIDAFVAVAMKNLAPSGYFTEVEAGGRNLSIAQVTDYSGKFSAGHLSVTFLGTLSQPVDPRTTPLRYAVFDPTYHIEMLHAKQPDAVRLVGATAGCAYTLTEPHPVPMTTAEAANLDRTQKAPKSFGALFAERVEIRCDAHR